MFITDTAITDMVITDMVITDVVITDKVIAADIPGELSLRRHDGGTLLLHRQRLLRRPLPQAGRQVQTPK